MIRKVFGRKIFKMLRNKTVERGTKLHIERGRQEWMQLTKGREMIRKNVWNKEIKNRDKWKSQPV